MAAWDRPHSDTECPRACGVGCDPLFGSTKRETLCRLKVLQCHPLQERGFSHASFSDYIDVGKAILPLTPKRLRSASEIGLSNVIYVVRCCHIQSRYRRCCIDARRDLVPTRHVFASGHDFPTAYRRGMDALSINISWEFFLSVMCSLIALAYYLNGRFTGLETNVDWLKETISETSE